MSSEDEDSLSKNYIGLLEAAKILGLTNSTVYSYVRRGHYDSLIYERGSGVDILFYKDRVEAAAQERKFIKDKDHSARILLLERGIQAAKLKITRYESELQYLLSEVSLESDQARAAKQAVSDAEFEAKLATHRYRMACAEQKKQAKAKRSSRIEKNKPVASSESAGQTPPTTEPVVETRIIEPVVEPVVEPVAEPVCMPVVAQAAGPVAEPVAGPVVDVRPGLPRAFKSNLKRLYSHLIGGPFSSSDTKKYIYNILQHRLLSDDFCSFVHNSADFSYIDDYSNVKKTYFIKGAIRNALLQKKGYFIAPAQLFCNFLPRPPFSKTAYKDFCTLISDVEKDAKNWVDLYPEFVVPSLHVGLAQSHEFIVDAFQGISDLPLQGPPDFDWIKLARETIGP